VARRSFEFVRDQIKHSVDFNLDIVTVKASEVLRHGSGFCFAKSHLLAALLRANHIPAALCYQRFRVAEGKFGLHGLNAVWLEGIGWYRVDARGNKPGVQAKFCPPQECLAFPVTGAGELDSVTAYAYPNPTVIDYLLSGASVAELSANLPDDDTV